MQRILAAAILALFASQVHATPFPSLSESVSICDPNNPTHCAAPDASGNLPTTGGGSGANVTPTDCSGTITAGGTAQNAIAASSTIHGFTIANIDSTTGSGEPLWISFTTTAAASTAGSYPLAAPTATTFAGFGSYSTPSGFGSNHAVSIIGVTTGHKFSCTTW